MWGGSRGEFLIFFCLVGLGGEDDIWRDFCFERQRGWRGGWAQEADKEG